MGNRYFGEYLLANGLVTIDQLLDALQLQEDINLPLGLLSIEDGVLTSEQVEEIFKEQCFADRMFGEIALSKGYMDPDQLARLLRRQVEKKIMIGEALVAKGYLTYAQVAEYLKLFAEQETALLDEHESIVNEDSPTGLVLNMIIRQMLRKAGLRAKASAVATPESEGCPAKPIYQCLLQDADTLSLAFTIFMGDTFSPEISARPGVGSKARATGRPKGLKPFFHGLESILQDAFSNSHEAITVTGTMLSPEAISLAAGAGEKLFTLSTTSGPLYVLFSFGNSGK